MSASIDTFHDMTAAAVSHFWGERERAKLRQKERGVRDQGNRAGVTAGKNLDGFVDMVRSIVNENGVSDSDIVTNGRTNLTIPGFFRPVKNWDLLVVRQQKLLAAIEFKSQVGPSFGNNFNNRVEEALGNATDLNTAFREGAFGESARPFVGYLFVLEDCLKSRKPIRINSPHFPEFDEFKEASYADRYEILCRKLVQEHLYDAAALVMSDNHNGPNGIWSDMSELTSARRFAIILAGRISGLGLE